VVRKGQAGGVSETMESARRWSGYVCPDCRFVFRVPRDHDGKGIVCPSCRRMLRIPAAGDTPPPLMATVRRVAGTEPMEEGESRGVKKRRRGRKGGGEENHSWEKQPRTSRSGRTEKRQMRLMLIGGASLFALMLGGVFYSMSGGDNSTEKPVAIAEAAVSELPKPEEIITPALIGRGEAAILAEAEPLARKFLEAKTVDELLPLVRDRAKAEGRMREFYQNRGIEAPGLSQFNPRVNVAIKGRLALIGVMTRDFEERSISFIDTPDGLKIDWESWVGWSEMPWSEFMTVKPSAGHIFRVTLSPVEYYNFAFADETKWQSYRLESPDQEHSIYGYVEKGSLLDQKIRPNADQKKTMLMLTLKFPSGAVDGRQVEIESLVTEGWVEESSP
jgi:hypothetical protein